MTRTQIINILIEKIKANSYLEIGVREPEGNYIHINCPNKVAVDPFPLGSGILPLTSDEFFAQNKSKFDVIFIDGLHHAYQVETDITNSLEVINENGYIVCHDMSPTTELMQIVPIQTDGEWTGDCWKAWVKVRSMYPNLEMYVIDTDYGVGIIKKGKQSILNLKDELTYNNLQINRKEWLNLISVDEFLNKINYEL